MNRRRFLVVSGLLMMGVSYWVVAREPTSPGGFTILHRSEVPDAPDLEIVMGILERSQKSASSKHYHPSGEFGFIVDGAVAIEAENEAPLTLEAGSSFYQPPGEWHVVSTSDTGARTILFRVVKKGAPMIVEVD